MNELSIVTSRAPASGWRRGFAALLAGLMLGWAGWAAAAGNQPTVDEVYQAAQAGQLDRAQVMIQQVLVDHPNSAKAHYVWAEIAARRGELATARTALAQAERLSPGLPFAKPQAVQNLKSQLAGSATASASSVSAAQPPQGSSRPAGERSAAVPFVLGLAAVLAVGGVVLLATRRRAQGASSAVMPGAGWGREPAATYPQAAWPQAYGSQTQAPQPGLGSRIAGGVATGLAVGAGAVVATEIGRRLFSHEESTHAGQQASGWQDADARDHAAAGFNPNTDLGGHDFGIDDAGSWDDGGGGGGDWDT